MKIGQKNTILIPISLLMLFVFSAAFTSFFVFGKQALTYIDGKKKEAIPLVNYTLIFLFAYTIIALAIIVITTSGLFSFK